MLQQSTKSGFSITSRKSIRSIVPALAFFSIITFASSDYANARGYETSLPPTAFNLGSGLLDYGKTQSLEYEKLMAKLPASHKEELYKVQKNYLDTIAELKVQIREKQRLHNLYLSTQGVDTARMRKLDKEIDSLEAEWNEKTNAFRAYLRTSYNTLISENADK